MTNPLTITLSSPLYQRGELEVLAGGLFLENLNVYITGVGQAVVGIHEENAECHARGCSVHAPSDHRMREFRTLWRSDRGLMERICEHGVGHPDPDHMAFLASLRDAGHISAETYEAEGVHGCDGCCVDEETWRGMLEENERRNEDQAREMRERLEEERESLLAQVTAIDAALSGSEES